MRRILIAVGLIALLLAGCASVPEPTPSPTVTGTATLTPTRFKVIVPTQVMYPTRTPYLSVTPTVTKIPSPTPTLLLYPTPEGGNYFNGPESISPTEKWVAWEISCRNQEFISFECIEFINEDASLVWSFVDMGSPIDMNSSDIFIDHWSVDNRFVYLVSTPNKLNIDFKPQAQSIIKISLVNGKHSYIITPREDPTNPKWYKSYEYAFSHNSQKLVYAGLNERSINFTLLDLYSGEVEYFSVVVQEGTVFGDITWSQNDRFFVFSVAENLSGIGDSEEFSIFLVDVDEVYAKQIYEHGGGWLSRPKWISDREVQYDYFNHIDYGELILNIETGAITEVEQ